MKKLILFILLIFTVTAFGQSAISRSPLWYMSGATTINPLASTWSLSGITNINYTGAGTGATLALGGATIGTNALAVTGTSLFSGISTFSAYAISDTLFGSTASGGNLFLSSTTHATKGLIYLGANSAYDQVNDRLGLGIIASTSKLHIVAVASGAIPTAIFDMGIGNNTQGVQILSSGIEASVMLKNTNTGGKEWQILSTGGAAGAGQGRLQFYNSTDAITGALISNNGINIGTPTAVDTQSPDLVITGDADSDGTDATTEALTISLTSNATPTLATWGFSSTQGAGYTFDKAIAGTSLALGGATLGTNGRFIIKGHDASTTKSIVLTDNGDVEKFSVQNDGAVNVTAISNLTSSFFMGNTGDSYFRGGTNTFVYSSANIVTFGTTSMVGTNDIYAKAGTFKGIMQFDSTVTIGKGLVGIDYTLTFNGETNDGVITYMEDEDEFKFDNNVTQLGNLRTQASLITDERMVTLADSASITIATGTTGWGTVIAGDNVTRAMNFTWSSDGTVALGAETTADVSTDGTTDDKLQIYDGGSGIVIKNYLGASKKIFMSLKYGTY